MPGKIVFMIATWGGVIAGALAAIATITLDHHSPGRQTPAQTADAARAALVAQVPARRAFDHAAEIVSEYLSPADYTRVWIRGGEDDLRLWSPAGRQMEMDFHAWYLFKGRRVAELPAVVQVSFETHGETPPGAAPTALTLVADGRPVPLRETPEPLARSGSLLFYTTRATLALGDFLGLVRAARVEGRCWGHPFVLTSSQMEILRDLASRLSPPSVPEKTH
jgi:hypothetical protein